MFEQDPREAAVFRMVNKQVPRAQKPGGFARQSEALYSCCGKVWGKGKRNYNAVLRL